MASHTRSNSESRRPRGPWKHGAIPVIGLTGEIGAGKSAAAAILAERGAFVLDADAVGHALLNQRPARDRVIARFGPSVLVTEAEAEPGAEPSIDRRVLGALVFADPAKRKALEAILHPGMRGTFERAIRRAVRKGQTGAIVLDAAILFEAGWNSLCDLVLYVAAPREQRLARLCAQRGWTDEVLRKREAAQSASSQKRARCDAVIENDASVQSLREALHRFWPADLSAAPEPRPSDGARRGRGPSTSTRNGRTSGEPSAPPRQR